MNHQIVAGPAVTSPGLVGRDAGNREARPVIRLAVADEDPTPIVETLLSVIGRDEEVPACHGKPPQVFGQALAFGAQLEPVPHDPEPPQQVGPRGAAPEIEA